MTTENSSYHDSMFMLWTYLYTSYNFTFVKV